MADSQLHPLPVLYLKLSEQLSSKEEQKIRNLLSPQRISKRTLENLKTLPEVFNCLQESGDITETNLGLLKELLEEIRRHPLNSLVEECEEKLREFRKQAEDGPGNSRQKDPTPYYPPLDPLKNKNNRHDDGEIREVGTYETPDYGAGHAEDPSDVLGSLERINTSLRGISSIPSRPKNFRDLTGSQLLNYRDTFLSAAAKGEVHSLNPLLQTGLDINCFDEDGNTALMLAANHGHIKCVNFLLEHNAEVERRNKTDETCLHLAISSGHAEIATTFLNLKDQKIMRDNEFQALLILAVEGDHSEGFDILLNIDTGTDNQVIKDYDQAFFMAAKSGSLKCLSAMLESEKVNNNALNENGDTVLHIATRHGQSAAVKLLLGSDVDRNAFTKDNKTALCLALSLHQSCDPSSSNEKLKIICYLLQSGCYVTSDAKAALLSMKKIAVLLYATEGKDYVINLGDEDYLDRLASLGNPMNVSVMVFGKKDVLFRLKEVAKTHVIESLILGNLSFRRRDVKKEMFKISKSLCLINTKNINPMHSDTWLSQSAKVISFIAIKLSFPITIAFTGDLHTINISHCFSKSKQDKCITIKGSVIELYLNNNSLTKLQEDFDTVPNLTSLIASNNVLRNLPFSLGHVRSIKVPGNPITNVPQEILADPKSLKAYLEQLKDWKEIPNKSICVEVVGTETGANDALRQILHGMIVGKRKDRVHLHVNQTPLTKHGAELKDVNSESLEVRSLFFAEKKLYVVTFDLDKFTVSPTPPLFNSVDERGRLIRWLNTIQSRAPNSRVILVGIFNENFRRNYEKYDPLYQLKQMILACRQKHKEIKGLSNCLYCCLCQPLQNMSKTGNFSKNIAEMCRDEVDPINVATDNIPELPHIVGYCAIPSKAYNEKNKKNASCDFVDLKQTISRNVHSMIELRPMLPECWNSLRRKLESERKKRPILSHSEFRHLAIDVGIKDNKVSEVLEFLTHEGAVIPSKISIDENADSAEIVCINPDYLLHLLSLLYNEVDEKGFLAFELLQDIWHRENIDKSYYRKIISLFIRAELCLPRMETPVELESISNLIFIHKLSNRQPNHRQWARLLKSDENIMCYLYQCGFASDRLFNDVLAEIDQRRGQLKENNLLRQNILYDTEESVESCDKHKDLKLSHAYAHSVRIKLLPYVCSVLVTVKGQYPCCILDEFNRMIQRLLQKPGYGGVVAHYQEACPKCVLTSNPTPGVLCERSYQCSQISDHTFESWSHVVNPVIKKDRRASYHPPPTNALTEYPRLFIVSTSSSLRKQDHVLHFLCECPNSYHFLDHPGYKSLDNTVKLNEKFKTYETNVRQFLRRLSDSGDVEKSVTTEGIGNLARSRPNLNTFEFTQLFEDSKGMIQFPHLHRVVQGDHVMYLCKEHASLFQKSVV